MIEKATARAVRPLVRGFATRCPPPPTTLQRAIGVLRASLRYEAAGSESVRAVAHGRALRWAQVLTEFAHALLVEEALLPDVYFSSKPASTTAAGRRELARLARRSGLEAQEAALLDLPWVWSREEALRGAAECAGIAQELERRGGPATLLRGVADEAAGRVDDAASRYLYLSRSAPSPRLRALGAANALGAFLAGGPLLGPRLRRAHYLHGVARLAAAEWAGAPSALELVLACNAAAIASASGRSRRCADVRRAAGIARRIGAGTWTARRLRRASRASIYLAE